MIDLQANDVVSLAKQRGYRKGVRGVYVRTVGDHLVTGEEALT
jgi:hypothetical protein